MKPRSASASLAPHKLRDLVELGEATSRRTPQRRGGSERDRLGSSTRPGNVAERNEPVSFTRHRLFSHVHPQLVWACSICLRARVFEIFRQCGLEDGLVRLVGVGGVHA